MTVLLSQLRLLYKPINRFLQRYIKLIIIMMIIVFAVVQGLSNLNIIRGPWATILTNLFAALALVFAILPWRPSFTSTKAREMIYDQIREYESIRHNIRSSNERTRNMDKVMMSMEGLAQQADYSPKEIKEYLCSTREGNRIAGLAILQCLGEDELRNGSYFEQVRKLMNEPLSPHEHYHSLEMLKMIWPHLTPTQQEYLWRDVRGHTRDWHASNSNTSEEWGKFYQWIEESISKGI